MNLVKLDSVQTINSLEFRSMINSMRDSSGEAKIRNDQFIARIEDEIDDLGVCKTIAHPQNGSDIKTYDLTIDQAMLIGMRESKAVRRAVCRQLKEMSRRSVPVLPTFPELLRQHADALERLEVAAPKVEHFDLYVARDGLRNLTDVAKSMGLSAVKLGRLLREHGMAFKRTDKMVWSQWFIDKEYGVMKQVVANEKDRDQPMITNAGDVFIKQQFDGGL